MKIDRLSRMKGHRIFRDFTWPNNLPEFARFNLVYGWNGAGKTTLSNLFRHLYEREPVSEGEVRFRVGGNDISGADLHVATLPQVRVFNRDTINRSIFEKPDQSLPPVYFLGEDSAEKQQRIEALKSDRQALGARKTDFDVRKKQFEKQFEQFRKERATSIRNLLTSSSAGVYFNSYDAQKFKKKLEETIASEGAVALSDGDRAASLAKKEGAPREKIVLASAQYPDFSRVFSRASALLSKSIVATTLEALAGDAVVSNWVGAGLKLHGNGDHCKFCDQPLPERRLQALEAHFNDAFRDFQAEVTTLIAEVDSGLQFLDRVMTLPDKALLYPHLVERYQGKVSLIRQQSSSVSGFLVRVRKGLVEKQEKPFKVLDMANYLLMRPGEEKREGTIEFLASLFLTAGSLITAYIGSSAHSEVKAIVDEHNRYTDNFSEEQEAARKALEADEVWRSIPAYKDIQGLIEAAKDGSLECQNRLVEIDAEIAQLEAAIRQHLKAADELTRDMASYLGREELQFFAHDTGYLIRRNGQPASNLSDGERTAVSFIYFLKSLEDTGFDLANGVVVIDDPVSSLDANSIYCAFGFMKSRLKSAGQLFVLTHNFTFFRQVNNWLIQRQRADDNAKRVRDSQMYMLRAVGSGNSRNAGITALDSLLKDYQSEYHYLFQLVHQGARLAAEDGMDTLYGMPNVARRLLESVMTFKYPAKAGKLQQQLDSVDGFDEAKRARIIRFTHSYSHNGVIGEFEHDLSIVAEGPEILRDVLELVRHVDGHHYDKMIELCR
ncbi:MAG: hypothetical protein K0Q68_2342 [Moraxellaceae bacterium]|jgi:wobble nucleotide-excising tRNase|nr:hypothetical protein [Moraxellaceae bacterium]